MHTVIVGGGFAGVKAALEISKKQLGKITLISDEPYFLHHATLYATATGREAGASVIDLEDMFALHHDIDIVIDMMKSIDFQRKLVVGKKGDVRYDTLILALGSVTNYFGIEGMATYSYGIKTLDQVRTLRSHLHRTIAGNQHGKRTYYIIGAGPSGVELAGAMSEYVRDVARAHHADKFTVELVLVEAAQRILPKLSKTASKKVAAHLQKIGVTLLTGQKVAALSKTALTIDSRQVSTDTVIWTSGVTNNPFFAAHSDYFSLSTNGRVTVNKFLEARDNIYVLGDNADTRYSGRAYTALQDAVFVADHLERKALRRPLKLYAPRRVAQSIPVGHTWAYVEKYGVYVAGRTGYASRRFIELLTLRSLLPHNQAMAAWRAYDKNDGECELCVSNT